MTPQQWKAVLEYSDKEASLNGHIVVPPHILKQLKSYSNHLKQQFFKRINTALSNISDKSKSGGTNEHIINKSLTIWQIAFSRHHHHHLTKFLAKKNEPKILSNKIWSQQIFISLFEFKFYKIVYKLSIVISTTLNIISTWAVSFGREPSSSFACFCSCADSGIKKVLTRNDAYFRERVSIVVGE